MHIPDGFLSAAVAAWPPGRAAPAAWRGPCAQRSGFPTRRRRERWARSPRSCSPRQLVNVPLLPGTSGHLVGGTLAAAIVGPWRGLVVMAVVLAVQALLFQDGGITAFGANLLAMGGAGALGGHAVAALVARLRPGVRGLVAGSVIGAFVATLVGRRLHRAGARRLGPLPGEPWCCP